MTLPESQPIVVEVVGGIGIVGVVLLQVFLAVRIAADVDELRQRGREPRFFGSVGGPS
jgi:hypothetical protein